MCCGPSPCLTPTSGPWLPASLVWICIIVICKTVYRDRQSHECSRNCTEPFLNSTNLQRKEKKKISFCCTRGPLTLLTCLGVWKGFPNLGYIQNHLLTLLLLHLRPPRTNARHITIHNTCWPLLSTNDITLQRLSQDLLSCIKFFYKLGLGIFLMTVNMYWQCRNFMVIQHGHPHPPALWVSGPSTASSWYSYCCTNSCFTWAFSPSCS